MGSVAQMQCLMMLLFLKARASVQGVGDEPGSLAPDSRSKRKPRFPRAPVAARTKGENPGVKNTWSFWGCPGIAARLGVGHESTGAMGVYRKR
jgi:hypothetical protein